MLLFKPVLFLMQHVQMSPVEKFDFINFHFEQNFDFLKQINHYSHLICTATQIDFHITDFTSSG